jgi:hypothetical protein
MRIDTRFIYDHPETRVIDKDIKITLEGHSETALAIYFVICEKLQEEGFEIYE